MKYLNFGIINYIFYKYLLYLDSSFFCLIIFGNYMKKLVLAGVVGLVSATAFADKPLIIQSSTPATLGTSPNYVSSQSQVDENKFSVKLGYAGTKLDSSNLGKARLNGFEIAGAYDFNDFGIWAKYENQDDGAVDTDQYSAGAQYKFYNQNNVYVLGAAGLGYANIKESGVDNAVSYKFDADYLFIPVSVEAGYMFTNNIGAYASLGYKWFYNRDVEYYENGVKLVDGKEGSADINGVSYGFGVRVAF